MLSSCHVKGMELRAPPKWLLWLVMVTYCAYKTWAVLVPRPLCIIGALTGHVHASACSLTTFWTNCLRILASLHSSTSSAVCSWDHLQH